MFLQTSASPLPRVPSPVLFSRGVTGGDSPSVSFPLRFPDTDFGHAQDEEWCEIYRDGAWKRLRLHDYGEIYAVPGLYEYLFYQTLQCCSPRQVVGLLSEVLEQAGESPMRQRVLDLGAGNGMVGEVLRTLGIAYLTGVDIEPFAESAAERDRPGLYDDYLVADLTAPDDRMLERLRSARLNCLVTVAALGFGDIPPRAFGRAFDLTATGGWVAFNLKESFFDRTADNSGFSRLIRSLWDEGILQVQSYRRYCHRLSIAGKPLHYVAIVARKMRGIPDSLMELIETETATDEATAGSAA